MKILIGDIGNTLTKLCLVNEMSKIIKEYNIETAKIIKQKKLKRIPATIFKYEKKSKFYYVRFWVCKGYRYNGCVVQSLKVAEERLAEKEAEKEIKNFNFKSAIDLNKKKINKSKRDYDRDPDRIADDISLFKDLALEEMRAR